MQYLAPTRALTGPSIVEFSVKNYPETLHYGTIICSTQLNIKQNLPSIYLKLECLCQVPAQQNLLFSFLTISTGLQTTHLQACYKQFIINEWVNLQEEENEKQNIKFFFVKMAIIVANNHTNPH